MSALSRLTPVCLLLACAHPAELPDARILSGTELPTAQGVVSGASADGVRSWKGLPYAAAPVGALRFAPPQPPASWDGVREARAFGSQCAQGSLQGGFARGEEDCLFLNIWAPDPAPTHALPVMVWIHGGAFLTGAGSEPLFDGAALARARNVVVVTVNYRLGPLGFLAHPTLASEPNAEGTGNMGLLDQRAALRWVRDNIHAFGGDEQNVTLFGESAGAWSVTFHLAAKGSAGLFHRAIIQSSATPAVQHAQTLDEGAAQAEALAAALGCTGEPIACLRARPAAEVIAGLTNTKRLGGGLFQGGSTPTLWLPVFDGVFLEAQPATLFAEGRVNAVPTLLGSNLLEGALFHTGLSGGSRVRSLANWEELLALSFGARAAEVAARYPATDAESGNDALERIDNDAVFLCPTRSAARALTNQGAPVFRYHFTRANDTGLITALGATHGAELSFVFGNDDPVSGGVSASRTLREQVQGYWTRFAATGDPNGEEAPAWPRYETASDPFITLNRPLTAGAGLETDTCDFWDAQPRWRLPRTW